MPSAKELTPHSCDFVIFLKHMLEHKIGGPPEIIFIFLAHVLGDDVKKLHCFSFSARKPGVMWESDLFYVKFGFVNK